MKLERFDMLIPESTKKTIYEMAEEAAIPPRTFGRMLLVEKIKEISTPASANRQVDTHAGEVAQPMEAAHEY